MKKKYNSIHLTSVYIQSQWILSWKTPIRGRNGRKVDVTIKNGALSSQGIDYSKNLYVEHPNTHVSFYGLVAPYWGENINIVKEAALQFPNVKSLGWDIVLTERGPLILEVNSDYDILAQQTCTQAFGLNVDFYNELNNYSKGTVYQKYFKNMDWIEILFESLIYSGSNNISNLAAMKLTFSFNCII